MERENLTARADAARNFPVNTCGASRHAQILAERLLQGKVPHQLREEPEFCGASIMATVAALWETRTERNKLRAELAAMKVE